MNDKYVVEPDIDHPEEYTLDLRGQVLAIARAKVLSLTCGQQKVVKYESGKATVIAYFEDGERI